MDKNTNKNKIFYNRITKRYLIVTIILFIFITSRQLIFSYGTNYNNIMINTADKASHQSMIINHLYSDLLLDKAIDNEFMESFSTFQENHSILINSSDDINTRPVLTDKINSLYKDLDIEYKKIITGISQLTLTPDDYSLKLTLDETISSYLSINEEIITLYKDNADNFYDILCILEPIIFIIIIGLALYTMLFVFFPAAKALKKIFWDINDANDNIVRLFQTMNGPLFLVRPSGEIFLMNSDAEELVTLTDSSTSSLNIKTCVNWFSINILDILKKTIDEERIDGINTQLEDSKGELRDVVISTIRGYYDNEEAVLITMFDLTLQKRAEEAIRDMAIRDELTGLYNRHFLESIINEEIDRSDRYEVPLSAFLIDLDHFKNVNDTWGHPTGDSVLQFTAKLLSSHTRNCDYVIRIGGEEFLVLMPHTDLDGAIIAAENIRKTIEATPHEDIGHFTASFGVVERNTGESYRSMYKRIDEALYQAKLNGRNRVEASKSDSNDNSIKLSWRDSWNCGERFIDMQHQELFALSNKLLGVHFELTDTEELIKKIDDLLDHIVTHFNYEERILERINYPDFAKHRYIHKQLITKGRALRTEAYENKITFEMAFSFIFDEIIIGHLLKEDVNFFPLIKKKMNK